MPASARATSGDALTRLDAALQGDVRVLVVALGVNDGLRGVPVERITANLGRIIEAAQARGIAVLLCAMEALPIYGWAYTTAFHNAYVELARPLQGAARAVHHDERHRERAPDAGRPRAPERRGRPGDCRHHLAAPGTDAHRRRASIANVMKRWLIGIVFLAASLSIEAASPIAYRFSFPEPQHHWMQVEASFTELGSAPLELRMSRVVAGPLLAARFREERLRRARVRRRRPASCRRRGPIRTGGRVSGHGGSVTVQLQGVRRPRGRHVSGHRHDARAHQHAGGDHVGARARRPAGDRDVRASRRARSGRSRRSCMPGRRRSSSPRPTFST